MLIIVRMEHEWMDIKNRFFYYIYIVSYIVTQLKMNERDRERECDSEWERKTNP